MVNEHVNRKKLIAVLAVIVIAAMISGVAAWLSDDETNTEEIVTGQVSISLRESNWLPENASDPGLVAGRDIDGTMQDFISAMKQHRVWEREKANCSMPMGQPA